eukprot:TRINITY_DN2927_c0_g2_i5.p1 TRINITY_DN2927_c0_g2~~TRINITY_DN2927_c0_g2_i5.p1  ORF type:complete len:386 (-),score=69.47 TRINITY_DN2927_c0_g2_i5:214-1371(-)
MASISKRPQARETCAQCGDPADLWCGGCLMLAYCGKECQAKHWPTHHSICGEMSSLSEADLPCSVTEPAEVDKLQEDCCAICLCDFESPVKLPCSHVFCCGCLNKTREANRGAGCPLCRARLPPGPQVLYGIALNYHNRADKAGGMAPDSLREYLPKRAVEMYKGAACQGHTQAMVNLGLCYFEGRGSHRDAQAAADLWEGPAETGHVAAQVNLGVCYFDGIGRTKDCKRATDLWAMAAASGDPGAQCNLGVSYTKGMGVVKDTSKAANLFEAAAMQGHIDGQHNLALCYDEGSGVERNTQKAVKWYIAAAKQGHPLAQLNLGVCFELGRGVAASPVAAMKQYARAAAQGIEQAQSNMRALSMRSNNLKVLQPSQLLEGDFIPVA